MITWLIFGRTPELAWAESVALEKLFFPLGLQRQNQRVAVTQSEVSSEQLMDRMGGLLRAGVELTRIPPDVDQAIVYLSELVVKENSKEIGLSSLDGLINTQELASKLKTTLRESGRKIAYRVDKQGELNSATSAYLLKHGVDIFIIPHGSQWIITKTTAVQNIEKWSIKDYGRPAVSPSRGMLPPKIARMMVNLGIGGRNPTDLKILDPFCGSGTILMEAVLLGCEVIGVDSRREAIEETQQNLEWVKKSFQAVGGFKLIHGNATHLEDIGKNCIDCIVTEPYLGPSWRMPPTPGQAKRTIDGLTKLYLGFLRSSKAILKSGSVIVLVVPIVMDTLGKENTFSLVDICEKLGYSAESGPYDYLRPKSIVKRKIWVLKNH